MRMHRGSSKGVGAAAPAPEHLPLSASPLLLVEVEVARAGSAREYRYEVPHGTLVKDVVRRAGEAPEGSAVLVNGRSVPLDTPLSGPTRLTVVPTFSGG